MGLFGKGLEKVQNMRRRHAVGELYAQEQGERLSNEYAELLTQHMDKIRDISKEDGLHDLKTISSDIGIFWDHCPDNSAVQNKVNEAANKILLSLSDMPKYFIQHTNGLIKRIHVPQGGD